MNRRDFLKRLAALPLALPALMKLALGLEGGFAGIGIPDGVLHLAGGSTIFTGCVFGGVHILYYIPNVPFIIQ